MLLQISEPNQSPNPHEHRYALGIDLGTTHSLVAVVKSGKAEILNLDNGDKLLPSVVYYGSDVPLVGKTALAQNDPTNTIISAKRFMGRSKKDIKFSHAYTLTGDDDTMPSFVTKLGNISPVQVSADILKALMDKALPQLPKDSLAGVVITVPAYFDEAQREATKLSAQVAGLEVLRLLNEPTAAALAYGLDKSLQNKTILVYDLGGGTFDVSVLSLADGVFEVLATGGNSALGGDDIDRLIANFLAKQVGVALSTLDESEKGGLIAHAKTYKQALSDNDSVDVDLTINGKPLKITLTNQILGDIIGAVINRTIQSVTQVLADANLDKSAIDEVILVGGSTRMPIIRQAVADFFGKAPLCSQNPDEVVAIGASILANQLINKLSNSVLLLDVTPLSLGLETMGGLVEVVIPRNTSIPITKRQEFTTHSDGQTGMVVHIVQGERDKVADCRSLASFTLSGIPPMKAGLARVEVSFAIDVNGQLTVSAKEMTTGVASQISVVPSNGLSAEQQEALLRAGFENASSDKLVRMLIETQVEAERELLAIDSALVEFGQLLSDDEKSALDGAMNGVKQAISSNDKTELDNAVKTLKTHSDNFASKIMNQSVQVALAGTSTDDWA